MGLMLSRQKGLIMESTTKRPSTSRTAFREDTSAPAEMVLHLEPATFANLFNITEPTISGTDLSTKFVEQLESVNLRFPVSKDGRPLVEITVLVDNIPAYVRQECMDECNRTIMRYMVAESFLAPRD